MNDSSVYSIDNDYYSIIYDFCSHAFNFYL